MELLETLGRRFMMVLPCGLRQGSVPLDHVTDVLRYPRIKTIKLSECAGEPEKKTIDSRKTHILSPRFGRAAPVRRPRLLGLKFQAGLAVYLGLIFFLGHFLFAAHRIVEPVGASLQKDNQGFMVRGRVHKGAVRMAVAGYTIRMLVDKGASPALPEKIPAKAAEKDVPEIPIAASVVLPKVKETVKTMESDAPDRTRRSRRPSGKLSALFESGPKGVRAIGYDIKGGTSYGKYQLSSRKGTMDMFIEFLEKNAPVLAQRLRDSGPANTKGLRGAMPGEWRRIAAEDPEGFEALQDDFIHAVYYTPALEEVFLETGFDFKKRPAVFREVLWSATVHHGPRGGAEVFIRAAKLARGQSARQYHRALLEEIFRERKISVARASAGRRLALENRLKRERALALSMLEEPPDTLLLSSM